MNSEWSQDADPCAVPGIQPILHQLRAPVSVRAHAAQTPERAPVDLNPIRPTEADPARLPDGGRDSGSDYRQQPVVCVGDIRSGYRKLRSPASESQPLLRALLNDTFRQACAFWWPADSWVEAAR
jgi:hypothetical protein